MAHPRFVRAHNTRTGAIQNIPRHWLEPSSPFPHFKHLPSTLARLRREQERQDSQTPPDTDPAPGTEATTDRGGSADTTKEQ